MIDFPFTFRLSMSDLCSFYEDPREPLVDVLDVLTSFSEVWVLNLFKTRTEFRNNNVKGPLGIYLFQFDHVDDALREKIILEDHHVGIDYKGVFFDISVREYCPECF